MTFARVLSLCLAIAVLALAVSGGGATLARADTAKVEPTPPFINQALPFYGCGIGASIGAASVALPSMTRWTFYMGVYPSMATVVWRSTLGCFYGILGGVTVSAVQSTARMVGDAFSDRH
jgi:hypothetical protein